jgi:hypothetical protein
MAAFKELIWQHIDVWAIVGFAGLATVIEPEHEKYRTWLTVNGYTIDTLDCTLPVTKIFEEYQKMFHWEEKFGYKPDFANRNFSGLRDAFAFEIPEGGGHVLELIRVDIAWKQDPEWVSELLSIAQAYTRHELALGRRFLTLLVVPEDSEMIGTLIEEIKVPYPYWE